nr:polyketide synthase [Chondromyces crocatus]
MHDDRGLGGASIEENCSTLVELLRRRAELQPSDSAYVFLEDGEEEAGRLTWASLDLEARAIAALLQEELKGERARALLLYPTGLEFVAAFMGCLYAGVVGVPAPAPTPGRVGRTLPRLRAIAKDAQASLVLTTAAIAAEHRLLNAPGFEHVRWVPTDDIPGRHPEGWRDPGARSEDLAFLQYTSGSTSTPRGAMVSHANLLCNVRAFTVPWSHGPDSVIVSWLPHFHDLGLVYGIVHALYKGCPSILMSPVSFVMQPARWLRAISRYRGTHSMGPNFAYELCVSKVKDEEKRHLDLRSWRVAVDGAEPIRSETVERFTKSFQLCGFRRETFCPGYGLAEGTLVLSAKPAEELTRFCTVDGEALDRQSRVIEVAEGTPHARRLVSSGRAVPDTQIVIAHPESSRSCGPGELGEIWARGPSVALGYWNRSDESRATFGASLEDTGQGPFLRTGDLGFLRDGEVFVTGRIKDMIIIRGHNHYPHDIEWVVQDAHSSLRPGCCAAFSADVEGEERLVVVAEIDPKASDLRKEGELLQSAQAQEILSAIRHAVSEQIQLEIYSVVLLQPGTIAKTSSGKLQRYACRAMWLEGTLETLASWQHQAAAPPSTGEAASTTSSRSWTADRLEEWLIAQVSSRLGVPKDAIQVTQPFARYGLSSLTATSLGGELEVLLGRRLPPTALWDHPSIAALARYLCDEPAATPVQVVTTSPVHDEPIAIVGIGCRFPGARGPKDYWRLLREGRDAITEISPDRWDPGRFFEATPSVGKMSTRWGGFLDEIQRFDADFFGIAPREAERMDPQQRILLEVAWEALEDAGLPPDQLAGSRTGVFIGVFVDDYARMQSTPEQIDTYTATGGARSIVPNRLSYLLDLRGPSMAVDSACSSSLVAIHLACQSLRSGESTLAIAGGVNAILTPHNTIAMSQLGAMAPDGRCKAFDARANGYVRSEGAGVVILKRLSDALRDRDPIYAVIRGSAVNQDGRTNGLTAPSRQAQEAVLREAFGRAGVASTEVQYVEAHGTGTPLGDVIEASALGAVLSSGASRLWPCAVGSVKTNIGHLEAAAGVAGLIKVALAIKERELPSSLHFETPNPGIPFDALALRVQQTLGSWPAPDAPLLAGVSSFGFGGTNAHMVLQEAPRVLKQTAPELSATPPPDEYLVPVSAQSRAALRELVRSLRDGEMLHGVDIADLAYTAGVRRSHHAHRLAIVARTQDELTERLSGYLEGRECAGVFSGSETSRRQRKIVFVFPGQGSQWAGMGRRLLEREPSFREALDACDRVFEPYLGWSIVGALSGPITEERLSEVDVIQPLLCAIQIALAAQWRAHGVVPDAVVGHSMGEVAAAHVAGILSLEDAARIICRRSRLLRTVSGHGAMALVELTRDEALQALAGHEESVSIAALNGPRSIVLAGEPGALKSILQTLERRDVFCRMIRVDVASHSPQMDPLRAELLQALADVQPAAGEVQFYSTVTGERLEGQSLDADYWTRNLREPVLFSSAVEALRRHRYDLFVELSPHPILVPAFASTPVAAAGVASREEPQKDTPLWAFPSMRRGEPERAVLLESLGGLYALGHPVNWAALHPQGGRCVPLPSYPWQGDRYWIDQATTSSPATASRTVSPPTEGAEGTPMRFYDALAKATGAKLEERYLTFGVLPRTVGDFSWILSAYGMHERPEHAEVLLEGQRELRRVLFGSIDFSEVRSVLDFGCGYASDLIALGSRHRHLTLDGYTLSAEQATVGREKIAAAGLAGRIAIHHRDSSKDDFPEARDLIFGFEVATHIKDKNALLSNIRRHLSDGGVLALADFFSTGSSIDFQDTASYSVTPSEWTELLSGNQLRVLECIDISAEVVRFLHDPAFEEHLSRIEASVGLTEVEKTYYRAMDNFGRALERGILRYVLMVSQKDRRATQDALTRLNQRVLAAPTPYASYERALRSEPVRYEDWFYEAQWEPRPRRGDVVAAPSGNAPWILFADQGGVGQALEALLTQSGEPCVLVTAASTYERQQADRYAIRPHHPEDLQRVIEEVLGANPSGCGGVVHLWSLDAPHPAEGGVSALGKAMELGCVSALHLVQALADKATSSRPRLFIVTRGAQPAGESTRSVAVAQAPLWGLGRTLSLELQGLWGGLMDLDPEPSPADAEHLFAELRASDEEDQVAFRQGRRWVARLERRAAQQGTAPPSLRGDASYLITGGLGDLGLRVAGWMVDRGARHLVLMSRTRLPERDTWHALAPESREASWVEAITAMEASGATVRHVAVDVADADQMRAFQEMARREAWPPIQGVVHAAGVARPQSLLDVDDATLWETLRPKVTGAWLLHEMFEDAPLDFFVLFSSGSTLLSSPGLGSYAAANAFLDALAHHRRAQGKAASSINWGFWAEVGMAAREQRRLGSSAHQGFRPEEGLEILGGLLGELPVQRAVMRVDWQQWRAHYPSAASAPFLSRLVEPVQIQAPAEVLPPDVLRTLTAARTGWQRRSLLEAFLREQLALVLKSSPARVDEAAPLRSMGVDSLMAIEFRNRLEASLGLVLPATLVWTYPTLSDLATHLATKLGLSLEDRAEREIELSPTPPAAPALDGLSIDEVASLLEEKLSALKPG